MNRKKSIHDFNTELQKNEWKHLSLTYYKALQIYENDSVTSRVNAG